MTAPCPAVAESLAQMNAHWVEDPEQGVLAPLVPIHKAYGVALSASAVLHAHGWRYHHVVPIRSLRTMLQVEQTIPAGH